MASHTRKVLIIGSFAVHGALAFGLFVSGIWRLERLDPERRTIGLAVMDPPAASGSPLGAQVAPLTPKLKKKAVVKELRQPTLASAEPVVAAVTASDTAGNGQGSGAGSGDNPDGDADDTGTCVGPACSQGAPQVPPPHVPPPRCPGDPDGRLTYPACDPIVVAPTVLKALRVSGETTIVPSDVVKTRMLRDGNTRSTGVFRVCIGAGGAIESVAQAGTTRYPEYDASLASAIRGWRYRPHLVGGRPVAACGIVTFVYTIK